jgi:AraC-like DNA-binding protein
MYTEPVFFQKDLPVAMEVEKVTNCHLHCHEGVIEVLLLLEGEAEVKVSFEHFPLKAGDFVVINSGDSHSIYALGGDAVILSLHFDMQQLKEHIPYLEYVLFACESFDLVKYKNETHKLRKMLGNMALAMAEGEQVSTLHKLSIDLISILVRDYDTKNYYSRNWDAGEKKTEKYYRIMGYIYRDYYRPNLVEYIAENEHYSKSHIVHLFKEVCASSFQDVLAYIRLSKAEKRLLDTPDTIQQISDDVGFSDVKYFTRNFKKWFRCTPSEYRKLYQPEVSKGSVSRRLSEEEWISKVKECLREGKEETTYRGAITPLNVTDRENWERYWLIEMEEQEREQEPLLRMVSFEIGEATDFHLLMEALGNVRKEGKECALSVNMRDMNALKLRELLMKCSDSVAGRLDVEGPVDVQLIYSTNQEKKIMEDALKQGHHKMQHLHVERIMLLKI